MAHSQHQIEEPVVGLEQVVGFAVLVVEFLVLELAAVGLALNKFWDFLLWLWDFWLVPLQQWNLQLLDLQLWDFLLWDLQLWDLLFASNTLWDLQLWLCKERRLT
jgi:hypothetical protein